MDTPQPLHQNGVKKFFSVIFLLIFILLGPFTLYAAIVQQSLLTSSGLKQQFRAAELGERWPQLMSEFFAAVPTEGPEGEAVPIQDPFLPFGGQDQFEQTIMHIWPAGDVYVFLDGIIDTVFVWWVSDQPLEAIPLVLSFSSIKERLKPVVIASLEKHVNSLPVCTEEELAAAGVEKEGDVPNVFTMTCRPEGFSLDELEKQGISKDQLAQMVLISIYDELDVGAMLSEAAQADPAQFEEYNLMLNQVHQLMSLTALTLRVLQIVCVLSLLLLVIVNIRSAASLFRHVGLALLLAGFFILAKAAFLYALPDFVTISASTQSEQLADYILFALRAVVFSVIRPALFVGIPLFLIGILFLILRHFFSPSRPLQTPEIKQKTEAKTTKS